MQELKHGMRKPNVKMNNLIDIKRNEEGKQIVSARELYLGLGLSKSNWSRWYPTNILKNDFFKEDLDWIGVRHYEEGNEVQDFAISIEFAKHIAMMAKTEKSHEYRNYFIRCEKVVKEELQTFNTSELSPELQMFKQIFDTVAKQQLENKQMKAEIKETKEEIQGIRDIVSINSTNWRKDTSTLISKMALKLGGYENINLLREESYKILEERGRTRLSVKLTNKRRRMADEGECKSKRDKLNKLDVIGDDSRLLEIYLAVVKDMAIKYGV